MNKSSVTQESPTVTINHEKTKLTIMRALILLSLMSMEIWQLVLMAGGLGRDGNICDLNFSPHKNLFTL